VRNLSRLGVHTHHPLLADFTCVVIARALAWEVTHGEGRQQDKDDGVQNQTTRLSKSILCCDPVAEDTTGRLVRHRAGDQGIKDGGDNVEFSSVGHFIIVKVLFCNEKIIIVV